MKVLILAAGYATRLYPLTLTKPKPLLSVAGKPMIEYVLDNIAPIGGIDRVYVVTNAKFADHFQKWADQYRATKAKLDFTIVNDKSTDDSNKLGAIGDLNLVITKENVQDDLIVVAGDNLFSQSVEDFGRFCREKNAPVLGVYDVKNLDAVKKYSSIDLAPDGRIKSFVEKPPNPTSTLIGIAMYFYPKAVLPLIKQYIAEGNNPDQPGRLIQWLYPRTPVYTWTVPGLWFDIGSNETLEEANRIFANEAVRWYEVFGIGVDSLLLWIAMEPHECYRFLLFMRISGSRIVLALLMAVPVFGQAPLPPLPSELPVLAPVTNSRVRRVVPIARPGRDISPRQLPATLSSNVPPAAVQRYQPVYVADDILKWDSTEKEIHAKEGELDIDFSFAVTNVSTGDVTINWVRPSCGCTVAKLPPTPWTLKPGDGGTIDLKLDLRGKFGILSKYVSVDTSHGQKLLMIKAHVPTAVAQPGTDSRVKNMQLAMADRQVVFRGDCAKCHAEPAAGKMGEQLYTAACAICHDAPHRATMVPDLRALNKATGPDYWSFWVANGKPGTLMPGFAKAHGGPLDEAQIRSLAEFLYEKFPRAEAATASSATTPPPSPATPPARPSGAGN